MSGDAAAGDSGSSADLSTSRDLALRMPPACAANQVLVPGGTFMMGAGDLSPESVPVHEVTVSSFCLDLTEVTVGMYAQCVAAGICKPADTGPTCNATLPDRKQHPINCLGWDYASKYCAWAAGDVAGVVGRLPTEAEWEYAARYDDQRDYPWGNAPPANQACWYGNADVPAHTCAIGSYPAGNAKLGLQDMAGNVYEWVFDGYADYAAGPATDPTGPPGAFQAKRVARGGSWDVTTKQRNLRAGARLWFTYYLGYSTLGFRCARANQ